MAGAGKKTFTAGETLTASDVNNYLGDQAVMYFGGTAARSSAIPTPTVGMTSYRGDTKQIESYDGSQWRGMSGLQLVKKQTIGTGVTSVTVTDAFSSVYDVYQIIVRGVNAAVDDTNIYVKFNNSGGSTYNYGGQVVNNVATNSIVNTNNGSVGILCGLTGSQTNASARIEIFNPFAANNTAVTSQFSGQNYGGNVVGQDKNAASQTGFSLAVFSGTITGGTIYVYGYGT